MGRQTPRAPAPAAPPVTVSATRPHHVRLFKGATRVATIKGGVPARAFVIMVSAVAFVAMFSIYLLPLILVFYPLMAVLSRNDDRAFWILELWVRTKVFARNKRYWNAISYTPAPYQRRRAWCRHKDA